MIVKKCIPRHLRGLRRRSTGFFARQGRFLLGQRLYELHSKAEAVTAADDGLDRVAYGQVEFGLEKISWLQRYARVELHSPFAQFRDLSRNQDFVGITVQGDFDRKIDGPSFPAPGMGIAGHGGRRES
jgi:hypothetical protein